MDCYEVPTTGGVVGVFKMRLEVVLDKQAGDDNTGQLSEVQEPILEQAEEEIWKPIEGWPYEVSNLGRIRRITYLSSFVDDNGYLSVQLWQKNTHKAFRVHRLVAKAHIPNPRNLPEVNHIEGNKLDPRASKLEWVDRKANALHAWNSGLYKIRLGEDSGNAKLTECQVRCIRAFHGLWRQRSIARHFGVSQRTVMLILNRRGWKHVR